MIRKIRSAIRAVLSKIRRSLCLARYNDFTVAGYFRKQGAQVGDDNRILVRSLSSEPYLVKIGNHCTIAPNVRFVTHDGAAWIFTEEFPSLQKFGPIVIEDNCFIGVGAILMPNIRIGPGSVVGAGSVVTKDVPPNTVVAGCPARPICSTSQYKEKVLRVWEQQRPPGYLLSLKDGVRYPPIYIQHLKEREGETLRRYLTLKFWGTHAASAQGPESEPPH